MKKVLLSLLVFVSLEGSAQTLIDSLSDVSFTLADPVGEKLVGIAMNNPEIKIIEKQAEGMGYDLQATKMSWLNQVTASFNLNEISLKQASGNPLYQNTLYPRYNFNLVLPLGMFFTKGAQIKKARTEQEEAVLKVVSSKAKLKELVLKSYQAFVLNKYLLAIEEEILQDELIVYRQAENRFKENTITLEAFTLASGKYNAILIKRLTLMNTVMSAKVELEGLLGMSYEEAMQKIINL